MASVRFDAYMEQCLYGTDGFYTSGRGSAGRRRDFITSPEVGPLFGAVISKAVNAYWNDVGQPEHFVVADIGSGPGALLKSLADAAPPCAQAWELYGLDRATTPEAEWPDLSRAFLIANELLDNLAFRIVEHTANGLKEVWVNSNPDGTHSEVLQETDLDLDIPVGTRAPVQTAAADWVKWACASGAGQVLAFDYAAPTTAELAARGGWLRTYSQHQRGADPYVSPGHLDITTDVAIDQLPEPTEVVSQADFLRRWGIEELVEEGRQYWADHAAAPDLAAIKMRSRVSESEALLAADGLGGWSTIRWTPSQT